MTTGAERGGGGAGQPRALYTAYREPAAKVDEVAICRVVIRGERFLFIANQARKYLAAHGAVPQRRA